MNINIKKNILLFLIKKANEQKVDIKKFISEILKIKSGKIKFGLITPNSETSFTVN